MRYHESAVILHGKDGHRNRSDTMDSESDVITKRRLPVNVHNYSSESNGTFTRTDSMKHAVAELCARLGCNGSLAWARVSEIGVLRDQCAQDGACRHPHIDGR